MTKQRQKHKRPRHKRSRKLMRLAGLVVSQISLALFCMGLSVTFGMFTVISNFKFGEDGITSVLAGFVETSLVTLLLVRIWDWMKQNDYL